MTGTLYVVATPIGNLEDITFRAVRVLREAARIACEDTRQTRKLLDHYGITTPVVSCHEHNEAARAPELIAMLEAGDPIALVSDAGTPLVSDPGYRLVGMAAARGIPVVPVPGPCAAVAALSAAGLATDSFLYLGFLPARPAQRRRALEEVRDAPHTLVLYETPHRILEALEDIEEALGDRDVVVARELTKIHEEFLRGTPAALRDALAARPAVKGEITLLVAKAAKPAVTPAAAGASGLEAKVEALTAAGLSRMEAIKQVARLEGLSKRELYRVLEGG